MQNKLFTPLKIGGIEIKNRIIMAPMCMYEVKKRGWSSKVLSQAPLRYKGDRWCRHDHR